MGRSGVVTIIVMLLVIAAIASYFFLRDESLLQKRNQTSAAQALLVEEEGKEFTDLTGEPVTVDEAFGDVMVVMSWASWCPQCTTELEKLGNLAKEYQARGVTVLAINRGEDRYTAERFLNTIPPLPGELRVLLDGSDHYFTHSAGYAMPETIVFAPDGSIAHQTHGELRTEEVKEVLNRLLEE